MFDDKVRTYSDDLKLFRKLGLQPFDIDCWTTHYVGEVKIHHGSVKITVQGAPAQFWKFEIDCKESNQLVIFKTGSGSLSNYWKTVELIANGMIVFELVTKHES